MKWLSAKRQTPITRKATFRPRFEELESRTLLATELGVLIGPENHFGVFSALDHGSERFDFTLEAEATFKANATFNNLTGSGTEGSFLNVLSGADFVAIGEHSLGLETINATLPAGNYELFVGSNDGGIVAWSLDLNADSAGDTLGTARKLGTVAGQQAFSDFVSGEDDLFRRDIQDIYRFETFTSSRITATLSGLTENADLFLIRDFNNDGEVDSDELLASSTHAFTSLKSINHTVAKGTFFLSLIPQFHGLRRSITNYSLALTVTPVDGAGSTLGTAKDIGTLTSTPLHLSDFVGNVDSGDIWKLNLAGPGPFSLFATLDTLSADANLELIRDADNDGVIDTGEKLATSTNTGTTEETISKTLNEAGTYFVRVRRGSGNTAYALTLSAVSTDNAGNNLATARNLNTLNGKRSFTQFVGAVDKDDFYKFVLAADSNPFTAVLSGLSANADLELIQQSTGNALVISANGSTTDESISRSLAAGTYFIRVKGIGDTNYTLTLTADYAGNSLSAARGVSPGTFNDFVGGSDRDDFYRITLDNDSTLTGTLNGLGADANLQLIFNANQNSTVDVGEMLAASVNTGTAADSFTRALSKGTYFVRVTPGIVSGIPQNTNYKLVLGVTPGSASIAGTTFEDFDRDGTRDAGEPSQPNVVVFLDANSNGAREDAERFVLTSTSGSYSFTSLNAGTYQVRQIVPGGFLTVPTTPAGGFHTVTLIPSLAAVGRDFGNVRPPASISGLVFNDVNGNGANGAGEPSQSDVVVFLDANSNGVREEAERFVLTSTSGSYSFTGLNAGTYQVRQISPPGFLAVPTQPAGGFYTETLIPGQIVTGRDFGNARPASIFGRVFDDVNGNGVSGTGDLPLANEIVFLDANNNGTHEAGEKFARTNADGGYSFSQLSAGTHTVRQELPAGFLAAPTAPATGFYTVTLIPGLTALGVDFGNVRPVSIAGQVFEDFNGNSVRDANDPPLANWTVFLDTNNNLALDATEPAVLSDSLGNYSFTNLRPGSYSVFQVLQAGFTQTLPLPAGSYSVALTSGQNVTGRNFAFSKLIVDNTDATLTGAWIAATNAVGFFGVNFLQDGNLDKGNKSARFVANIPVTGSYQVFARWTAKDNRASNTPIDVVHRDGTTTVFVDQRTNGGVFVPLGTFFFSVGLNGIVVIRNGGTIGQVVADAIQFVRQPPVAPGQLAAAALPGAQVLLTWQDKSLSESGFKIQRSTSRYFKQFEEITVSTVNATSFTDAMSKHGTHYYRVLAYGVSGPSRFSNVVEVRA